MNVKEEEEELFAALGGDNQEKSKSDNKISLGKMSKNEAVIIFIIIPIIVLGAAFALYFILESTLSSKTSYKYHKENIETISNAVSYNDPESIVLALEECGIILEKTELDSDYIVKRSNNEYEIYDGISIRVLIKETHFEIYTYETKYSSDGAVLLYNSLNETASKVLTEEERAALKESQRKYEVQSTVDISPGNTGLLLQNALGSTKLTFTIKNVGNTKIDGFYIEIVPGIVGGGLFDSKTGSYSSYDSLARSASKEYTLTKSNWSNFDYYKITKLVLYFSDGTAISFNAYDCQFL